MDAHAGAKRSRSYEYLIWPDRDKGDICHCNSRDGKSRDGGEKEGEAFHDSFQTGRNRKREGKQRSGKRVSGVPQHV